MQRLPIDTRVITFRPISRGALDLRRADWRAGLDIDAAHVGHERLWKRYVFEHDGYFEEQADELRRRITNKLKWKWHRENINFHTVEHMSAMQPRTLLPWADEREPVNPRTVPVAEVEHKSKREGEGPMRRVKPSTFDTSLGPASISGWHIENAPFISVTLSVL